MTHDELKSVKRLVALKDGEVDRLRAALQEAEEERDNAKVWALFEARQIVDHAPDLDRAIDRIDELREKFLKQETAARAAQETTAE